VYNKIGLSGVLLIDFASYVVSFSCYLFVRSGRVTVAVADNGMVHESAPARFIHELREGLSYIRLRPRVQLTGICWALFIGGMLTQGVITAPFSDRILQAGAVGYGWLNAGWAIGAFLSAIYIPALIRGTGHPTPTPAHSGGIGHRSAMGVSMGVLGLSLIALPFLGTHVHGSAFGAIQLALLTVVMVYCVMGCARGLGGVAITSTMMELVPKHFMGRVQNTFYFLGTLLQLVFSFVVGTVAHNRSLTEAFAIVGAIYLLACLAGSWPVKESGPALEAETPAQMGT
jgi:hypothetical protein